MTEKLKAQLAELLKEKERRVKNNKIQQYFPDKGKYPRKKYKKHVKFMNSGKTHSERAFVAANRVGKTVCAACEISYHLTGEYPDWWKGKVFNKAVDVWVAGVTNETTRDVIQRELLGKIGEVGTGFIPKEKIGKTSGRPGIQNAIGFVQVKHSSGDWSTLEFKSYVQGWETFQGTKKDVIWLDEEPKDERIYTECLTRTAGDTGNEGIILCTFTPLSGYSNVVLSFLPGGKFPSDGQHPEQTHKFVVNCSWDDVPHLSEEWKEQALASFPPHLRDAKSKGIPKLGSGAIYPIAEEYIVVEPFEIPEYWPKTFGMDFGWNKTAVIWAAIDPQSKVTYLYSEHYLGEQVPAIHAEAIKQRGAWMYGVGDPAGGGSSQRDGTRLFDEYQLLGINVYPAKGGPNTKEPRISKILTMLESGQLKIFSNLNNWLTEYRIYRREEKNGKLEIVKSHDHLMDATQYLISDGLDLASTFEDLNDSDRHSYDNTRVNPITGY